MNLTGFKQDYVTEIVREWLLSGKYCCGDTLPGNQELSGLLGVNPRTIANGLKPLVEEGIIERVPRRGTVVKKALIPIRTSAVGLVLNSSGEFYSDMTRLIDGLLAENGLFPVLINGDLVNQTGAIEKFLNRMVGKTRPYGYLILGEARFPYHLLEKNPNKFANSVFLLRYQSETELPHSRYVLIDYEDLGRQVVEYFARRNVRRILFPAIREINFIYPAASLQLQIMHCIRKYAEEAGLIFDDMLFMKTFSFGEYEKYMAEAIREIREPAGIFGWFDAFLDNEIRPALQNLGKDMFRDFAVLGNFNTSHAAKFGHDSFDLRIDEICRIGVDMLTGKTDERKVVLNAKLAIHRK